MDVLALDIGNSDIKFGLFRNGELHKFWRASDYTQPSPHKISHYKRPEAFSNAFRAGLAPVGSVFDGLVYSTVVPEVEPVLKKTIQYCFKVKNPLVAIRPGITPLPIRIDQYPLDQLGTDRAVSACGAYLMYPGKNLIIVDFGTATTFDVVTADGVFLGGAIAPGIDTFADALPDKASLLPRVPFGICDRPLGNNTVDCLLSGTSIGYRGMVKELLCQIQVDLSARYGILDVICLATGGGAEQFIAASPDEAIFSKIEPTLTIKGLYTLYLNTIQKRTTGVVMPAATTERGPSAPSAGQSSRSYPPGL